MQTSNWQRNGFDLETDIPETLQENAEDAAPALPREVPVANRLTGVFPAVPAKHGKGTHTPEAAPLAVFCYEAPDSPVGRHVAHTVAALGTRRRRVHLFATHDFVLDVPGVHMHRVGVTDEGDLLARVDDFTNRACNAFLQQFPAGSAPVALLGHEWSSIPVLSILRGLKNVSALLSLHSLERQRSDLSSEMSRRIDDIELSGIRAAKAVLVHDQASAEIAKYWAPECGDRITAARPRFPVETFDSTLDPGAVKARYQVGPVDPTILYIGDLSDSYGPDLLMKAMPAVLKNHKQARCIFVGDGAQYWPLRVYARYLLLEHAVRLVGHLAAQPLHELIQAADIIAVPSREATPWWPLLAAWAARRPVVATHPAAPGLLSHEQDSVLAYPSENSLVWGLERVLFDTEFAQTITRAGSAKLEERFGWNILAEQIEELLEAKAARV